MTREEIKNLRELVDLMLDKCVLADSRTKVYKRLEEVCDLAIKAVEQQSCEDEYIKVPKKALKYRTAGMVAYNAEWLKNHFDIERSVICGEQEPCEDAISRQEVKELYYKDGYIDFRKICELPPVTPQPKTGHWIRKLLRNEKGGCIGAEMICSKCGNDNKHDEYMNYCPNCGAKMVEPQESEMRKNAD